LSFIFHYGLAPTSLRSGSNNQFLMRNIYDHKIFLFANFTEKRLGASIYLWTPFNATVKLIQCCIVFRKCKLCYYGGWQFADRWTVSVYNQHQHRQPSLSSLRGK